MIEISKFSFTSNFEINTFSKDYLKFTSTFIQRTTEFLSDRISSWILAKSQTIIGKIRF